MCHKNVYTEIQADGRQYRWSEDSLCSKARHSKRKCDECPEYLHPPRQQRAGDLATAPVYGSLPPTPQYTPRSSTSSFHASGYESDRSPKRRSGVYINGTKIADINTKSRRERRNERVVLVDGPPTPRSPPRQYTMPVSAPSSPLTPYDVYEPQRPYFVDERNQLRPPPVIVENSHRPSHHNSHRRHGSKSSSHSYDSSSAAEEERRLRQRTERKLAETQEALRQARIDRANAEIRKRPAVPVPPQPTRYRRPSVLVQEDSLVNAMEQIKLGNQAAEEAEKQRLRRERRERERRQREEEEALDQRLRERMMPKRRATVGPGSRRSKVMYENGLYRWE